MSNLKLPTMSFYNLCKIAIPAKGEWKKIAYETYVRYRVRESDNGLRQFIAIDVRHHHTVIATIQDKTVTLDNGGYVSSTTTNRMNRVLRDNRVPFSVAIRNFEQVVLDHSNNFKPSSLTGYRSFKAGE